MAPYAIGRALDMAARTSARRARLARDLDGHVERGARLGDAIGAGQRLAFLQEQLETELGVRCAQRQHVERAVEMQRGFFVGEPRQRDVSRTLRVDEREAVVVQGRGLHEVVRELRQLVWIRLDVQRLHGCADPTVKACTLAAGELVVQHVAHQRVRVPVRADVVVQTPQHTGTLRGVERRQHAGRRQLCGVGQRQKRELAADHRSAICRDTHSVGSRCEPMLDRPPRIAVVRDAVEPRPARRSPAALKLCISWRKNSGLPPVCSCTARSPRTEAHADRGSR